MHWIVQDNLFDEEGYSTLVTSLDRLEIPYDVVKVVPFSHELIPEVNPTGLVVVCGSTTLSKIAVDRGWTPGTFWNSSHDFRQWRMHYGGHLLNDKSEVCRFADVTPFWTEFFIRPCHDDKSFNGKVYSWTDFKAWQRKVIDLKETYTTLDATTMVCYAPVKEIWTEYRFFIIDGRLVTQSQYKLGNRVVQNAIVEDDAIRFAQQMVDLWRPSRGFVLDIALTEDGYRVIEINCLNSAGFYAANIAKLIEAIEDMYYL